MITTGSQVLDSLMGAALGLLLARLIWSQHA